MSDEAEFELRLIDKVSGTSRGARFAIDKLTGSLKHLGAVSGEAGSKFEQGMARTSRAAKEGGMALDVFKGNLLTSVAHEALHVAEAVAEAGAELITFGQNSRLAFDQLKKHGATGEELFDHSRALARRFGLDVIDTTKSYQKFLALQFTPKGADKLIRMGADLRILGNDAENVKGIFTALGQIKSKGKFQAEEGMQLAERGISGALINEEIGKLLGGKTRDEVAKLQQKGKISADVALEAIENAINRKLGQSKLGESGAKFADKTLAGMWGRAKALAQDKGLDIVDKMTEPLTRIATRGLDKFEKFISSPEGGAFVDKLADGLDQAAEFAGELADAFGEGFSETWKLLGEGAKEMFDAFGGGKGADALDIMRQFARDLGQVTALGVGFGIAFGRVALDVGALATTVWHLTTAIVDGLVKGPAEAIGGVLKWWDELRAIWDDNTIGFFRKSWELGKQIVSGLVGGVIELADWPRQTLVNVASKAIGAVKDTLGIHSPSRVFAEMGGRTAEGFALGIDGGVPEVERSSMALANAHVDTFQTATHADLWGPPATTTAMPSPQSFARPAMGFGPVSVTVQVDVHGSADPEETGRAAGRAARREMESFFTDLAAELGAS